ncbi:NAD(P)-dependent dehydrogenase (short-subunit alcohol dehydrogenase family) [Inquilinus ginsengisoli]|uniref:NAD(P)-dependent dehydrogenase (Short-subunit alcohol dehydrogenase family) n=1 Tax=Inquilinus ginsengisoli TaxID=363840 RepID=A0ABU1JQQ8_9PROT|nr:SDR family NAD(P)-dependent oxidoreductase [Inquilinus ginsengisoli]MDR6290942.1 NAD(P)-dependent dehydrogenase (short-subunit alcohol dehydrogenase family) [Inquilinus ginsengisoli]
MSLQDQVAVVTGAGRGIGRETALHLARAGATLAVLARTEAEIEETAGLVAGAGGVARAYPVDLVDLAAVETVFSAIGTDLGPVDLLVNNHGSFRAIGPVWEVDPGEWWGDVETNLRGTFHTARAVAPGMIRRGRGRIVNLVGGGTGVSFPNGSGYASSKAAIMRFTECLNDTLKAAGPLAFAVDPGLVRTAMTEFQLESASGKAHLPNIADLFDRGVDIPPTRAATLITAIAAGRFDRLAGRMLRGVEDLDELERAIPAIVEHDLRALRLTGL